MVLIPNSGGGEATGQFDGSHFNAMANDRAVNAPSITIHRHVAEMASDQIKALRRENEILRAKVDTFEKCFKMMATYPHPEGGMGGEEDAAWRIDRALEQFDKSEEIRRSASKGVAGPNAGAPGEG